MHALTNWYTNIIIYFLIHIGNAVLLSTVQIFAERVANALF